MPGDDLSAPDWARYGTPIDMTEKDNSRVMVLDAIGREPQRILELGPSAGLMTAVLHEWGHRVTGVEIDPDAAELASAFADDVVVGDLDSVDSDGRFLLDRFAGADFDTLIAADVLEHVRRPADTLERALRCVKPDGRIFLSIPNVAHADIRLSLVDGRFDYTENGLMDRTHIQMFTLRSLVEMIRSVGLAPVTIDRTVVPIGDTELGVDRDLLEFGRRVFADDPEAETYQWIVTCRRADVVGDSAAWPTIVEGRPVVDEVVELMTLPPPPPPPVRSIDDTPTTELISTSVRRCLGFPRRRLRALLDR